MAQPKIKVALVHDWLLARGGAERVLQVMHQMWPDAPIYVAAYNPGKFPEFAQADVRPTWLDRFPFIRRKHQLFPMLLDWAFSSLDLSEYDLVISSCSAQSKYIRTGPNTLHVCFCYTPIRYFWSDYDWYRQHPPFGLLNPLAQGLLPIIISPLRRRDYNAAQRVDQFVAQSHFIAGRIKKYYHRNSAAIIYPPIDYERFAKAAQVKKADYFLVVGRQVAYKRLDLVVQAFNRLGLPLVVAGSGEEIARQKAVANSNIEFRGFVAEDELPKLYAGAAALVYPQIEDFGLVPLEAQAAGTPVIAYAEGGAAETVMDGETGVLFDEQTEDGLEAAVRRFQSMQFDQAVLQAQAKRFDIARFKAELGQFAEQAYQEFELKHNPK